MAEISNEAGTLATPSAFFDHQNLGTTSAILGAIEELKKTIKEKVIVQSVNFEKKIIDALRTQMLSVASIALNYQRQFSHEMEGLVSTNEDAKSDNLPSQGSHVGHARITRMALTKSCKRSKHYA